MENQVTNYKCPACTGPIHFDSATGKMVCDYCDSVFEVSYIEELYKNDSTPAAAASQEEPGDNWNLDEHDTLTENADIRAYNCPSCGAKLLCDVTTSATSCPYCGNPTIIPASISGTLKPDMILPFKLDKEAAKAALREHLKGKRLLPVQFSSENHLDEIKGIYVPFWLFDAQAKAEAEFSGTKIRTWSDREYNYTETKLYHLDRCGRAEFLNIPVDGSKKMADDLMESLEPFDISEAVEFQSAYLTGYFADKYDVSADDCVERANKRVKETAMELLSSTAGAYAAVKENHGRVRVSNGKGKYILLPVWILNSSWKGNRYTFAMNGQTGKFVGDLPVDKGLAWKWRLIYGGGFALLLTAIEFAARVL